MKKSLKLILKLTISFGALVLVFRKIDLMEIWELVSHTELIWLLLATLAFVGSKLISAIRLWGLFSNINLQISRVFNAKLYLLGMFYNTILPGGIGGDGYKVWLLSRQEHFAHIGKRKILQAIFYDRLIGLWVLALIITISAFFLLFYSWLWGIFLVQVIGFIYLQKKFFISLEFLKPALLSIGVQLLQIISVYFIIQAIGVEAPDLRLITVFLVSSVASAIPVSIGGIGVRELVFLYLSDLLNLLPQIGVSIALLFFSITFLVSLFGMYYSFYPPEETVASSFSINHKQA